MRDKTTNKAGFSMQDSCWECRSLGSLLLLAPPDMLLLGHCWRLLILTQEQQALQNVELTAREVDGWLGHGQTWVSSWNPLRRKKKYQLLEEVTSIFSVPAASTTAAADRSLASFPHLLRCFFWRNISMCWRDTEQDAGEKTSYAEASEVNFMMRVNNSSPHRISFSPPMRPGRCYSYCSIPSAPQGSLQHDRFISPCRWVTDTCIHTAVDTLRTLTAFLVH